MARHSFKGRRRFDRILRELPKASRETMHRSLLRSGHELANAQRALAPVDDGDLRRSIRVIDGLDNVSAEGRSQHLLRIAPNDLSVFVAAGNDNVFYGHFLEFGTVKMAARPFFLPPFRIKRRSIASRARSAARRAAKQVAGR